MSLLGASSRTALFSAAQDGKNATTVVLSWATTGPGDNCARARQQATKVSPPACLYMRAPSSLVHDRARNAMTVSHREGPPSTHAASRGIVLDLALLISANFYVQGSFEGRRPPHTGFAA